MLLKLVCVLRMLCVFRDSGKSLDIFDEKLHPLSVSMLIRFPQTQSESRTLLPPGRQVNEGLFLQASGFD